jgi:hypothetical protein
MRTSVIGSGLLFNTMCCTRSVPMAVEHLVNCSQDLHGSDEFRRGGTLIPSVAKMQHPF